ncbi:MAG: fold metallo-hydrolase [Nevskia sp.]|nr:fold metallo-hydrolase [Nevskia sp.]
MRKTLWIVAVLLVAALVWNRAPQPVPKIPPGTALPQASAPAGLRFALIKTADAKTLQAFTYAGGSPFKTAGINHIAVLVEHPQGRFLFDTGLGTEVEKQFATIPFWARPFLAFDNLHPAVGQLTAAKVAAPDRIILSHAHWDHASALGDFPDAKVWVTPAEKRFIDSGHPPTVLPTQFQFPAERWHLYELSSGPYAGFDRSLDLFGDGSAVLLPLPGHTPGSVGLLLSVPSGQRYFFVGDLAWNSAGITGPHRKFSLASKIVDLDAETNWQVLLQVRGLLDANPGLHVVPAHDTATHDAIGYFPNWVQ